MERTAEKYDITKYGLPGAVMSKWSNWNVIYTEQWSAEFKNIVRKRIPHSSALVDDTMQDVRQELAISLAKLSTVPDSINAYLRTAFRHTLEDYLRKKEGYPRPPEWIKRLGAAYERIYKLLCLENRPVNDIHATLSSLFQYSRKFIEQVVAEVRAGVVNCGTWRDTVSVDSALNEVEEKGCQNSSVQPPDTILENLDSESVIGILLGKHSIPSQQLRSKNFGEILQHLQKCEIDDDARLLLRMIYTDGYSVSQAARILQLPDALARKQVKSTLKTLQQALSAVGITDL